MDIEVLDVLITVVTLILLGVPGFILVKTKLLNKSAEQTISALVLYGCQPVMVFMSFQETYTAEKGINMLIVAGLAILIHAVMIGLVALFIRNKSKSMKLNCAKAASVFSNCGFMGLPFVKQLFPSSPEIIIYAAIIIAVFNLTAWSVGVWMISGDKKNMNLKHAVFNPTTICTILGIILFVSVQQPIAMLCPAGTTGATILTKLSDTLNIIGDLVTPLAMTLIGIKLANISLKKLFLDKWAYIVSAIKLVGMSLVTMLIVAFLPVDDAVKYSLFFLLSMPTAASTVLFAVQFGGDGEAGSVYVLLSTILSIATIPLMFLLFTVML